MIDGRRLWRLRFRMHFCIQRMLHSIIYYCCEFAYEWTNVTNRFCMKMNQTLNNSKRIFNDSVAFRSQTFGLFEPVFGTPEVRGNFIRNTEEKCVKWAKIERHCRSIPFTSQQNLFEEFQNSSDSSMLFHGQHSQFELFTDSRKVISHLRNSKRKQNHVI